MPLFLFIGIDFVKCDPRQVRGREREERSEGGRERASGETEGETTRQTSRQTKVLGDTHTDTYGQTD